MPEKTFAELEAERNALEAKLTAATAQNDAQVLKIRAMEAKALEAARATADEALAQRVAEILASKMSGPHVHGTTMGQPASVIGHQKLICRNCGHTRDANDQETSKNPSAGGCKGYAYLTHDFHGADTVIETVDALMPHHAIYIDGTVTHPANA